MSPESTGGKKIDLFFNGERLVNDEVLLQELNKGKDIDLMMLSMTISESMMGEESKYLMENSL